MIIIYTKILKLYIENDILLIICQQLVNLGFMKT